MAHPTRHLELVRCVEADCNLLADWCDSVLGRDYFFKRRHILSILQRPTNDVWAVRVDGFFGGMAIVYRDCVLDNLYIAPEYREGGIGSAVLQELRPQRIRSKTNMLAGDPTPFYERNGYVLDQPDPERPHIKDMVLPTAETMAGDGTTPKRVQAGPAKPVDCRPAEPAGSFSDVLSEDDSGRKISGRCSSLTCGNGRVGDASAPGHTHGPAEPEIVASPPPVAAVVPPAGMALVTKAELAELKKIRDTRERVRAYRAKRKAEQQAIDGGGAAVTAPAAVRRSGDSLAEHFALQGAQ